MPMWINIKLKMEEKNRKKKIKKDKINRTSFINTVEKNK